MGKWEHRIRLFFGYLGLMGLQVHEPTQRQLVGRLLMVDFKTNKCKIWDPTGKSHLVPFEPSIAENVRRAVRGWVEAVITSETVDEVETELISHIVRLSEEEADELVPPRHDLWSKEVLDEIRADTQRSVTWLRDRDPRSGSRSL